MIEVAGDIYLRRPRPTQGCRADDNNDDGCLSSKFQSLQSATDV
jgi:hypothetical protein